MTPTDLQAVLDAVEPVYAAIEEDSQSADLMDDILLVKEELGARPATLVCPWHHKKARADVPRP